MSTTRRDIMGGIGGAGLVAIAAAAFAKPETAESRVAKLATLPDAELIAIGRKAAPMIVRDGELSDQFFALEPTDPALTAIADQMTPLDERLEQLIDAASELPATTQAGRAVKAMLLRWIMRPCKGWDYTNEPHGRLAWSITDDLIGSGA